ncbi:hypothetical protein BN1723_003427 [Verticillium longisporum]|uniref:Uncharacterized protein n=2 Tax=Verticillium longisporum TaxID=100787 RepID=A0A0G4M082_VERLO|nr:hypothetical protein BN1723_003427 [Verticillium longisporum]
MTATMAASLDSRHFFPTRADALTAEDFETASIRSAAPSYISEAPSYHSVAPFPEAIPPYTPPGTTTTLHSTNTAQPQSRSLIPDIINPRETPRQTTGLPPIPPLGASAPRLSQFQIPTWSTVRANPCYLNVARRRANSGNNDSVASIRRAMLLDRVLEDEDFAPSMPSSSSSSLPAPGPASSSASASSSSSSFSMRRHLEDPHLVGEVAAAEAKRKRLARERGNDILAAEDRQWNFFLAQMGDIEERDRSLPRTRRSFAPSMPSSSSSSLPAPGPASSSASASSPSSSFSMRRHLEDPHLVGEVAAAEAKRKRLARERGNDILVAEDRQWNFFLAQMGDIEERDRSLPRTRRSPEPVQRRKPARRLAGRLL